MTSSKLENRLIDFAVARIKLADKAKIMMQQIT